MKKVFSFHLLTMKQIILLLGFGAFLVLNISCKKKSDTNTNNPDKIYYSTVDKILIKESADTVDRFVFEIYKVGDSLRTRLRYVVDNILGDGGHELLYEVNSGNILLFNLNDVISGQNRWDDTITSNNFSLNNFSGQGNKYIGFRNFSFPDGKTRYCYGWYQIMNSINNDTLKIIDMAVNQTEGNSIKAGQKK